MSLLDEAIREHLELKRRRGADPTEIARQESEVFGSGRRESEVAETEDAEPAGAVPFETYAEPEAFEDAPVAEPDPPRAPEAPRREPEPASPVPEPEPRPTAFDEPSAAAPAPPTPRPEPVGQPTAEFAADEVADALGEPAPDPDAVPGGTDEDELAETPEFLQETPEHDRLWFEQKPPKDFDF